MTGLLKNLTTIIMAGGKGERLFPLTRDKTKPAITFGGIYRIIDFTLSNCINSGIRRIYVLSQYGSFSLEHHLKLAWNIMHPELHEFIEQSLGRERSDLEAAIRQRIIEDAQEVFIEYAKTELMIALGLSRRAVPWTDGEAE